MSTPETRHLLMEAVLAGDALIELKARNQPMPDGMSDIERQQLMAAARQFTSLIRSGMGPNQALAWMINAGWLDKVSHQVLSRMGG
jgi:hypothetical protein